MSENSEKAPSTGGTKKRRQRRRKPSGANRGAAPAGQQAQSRPAPNREAAPQASVAANPARKNKRRRRSGNKGSQSEGQAQAHGSALDRLVAKYENLRVQHIEARRKYFDLFERADPQQKDKLERVFTNTMLKMKEFEDALTGEDQKLFNQHYNGLKEDRIYSENHELDPEGEKAQPQGQFEDPHYLISQKNADYNQDTEESMGSIEDYMAYKGITPES